MSKVIRIGTRESELALWQANEVKRLLEVRGCTTELVLIKSDGDIDLITPLYELGVQGVFTKTLDAALLSHKIDIAVHSLKDVPTQLAHGLSQAAVLPRGSYQDIFVPRVNSDFMMDEEGTALIATSSIRRRAQWWHKYPNHAVENLRGNVNTRMRKVQESNWDGAIFAAAGLERIGLRPDNAIDLTWMLPAPAQGAVTIVCREDDTESLEVSAQLNDKDTALCTRIERDFLRTLLGGCSTPISALATIEADTLNYKGNIMTPDGKKSASINKQIPVEHTVDAGIHIANELLQNGGQMIVDIIRNAGK
jgi:hydroxymethylbilane synthase